MFDAHRSKKAAVKKMTHGRSKFLGSFYFLIDTHYLTTATNERGLTTLYIYLTNNEALYQI